LLKALAEFKAKKNRENPRLFVLLLIISEKVHFEKHSNSFIPETIRTRSNKKYKYPKLFIIKSY